MLVAKLTDVYASVAVLAFAVLPLVFGLPELDTSSVLVKSVWVGILGLLLYKKYFLTAIVLSTLGLLVRYVPLSHDGILAKYAAANRRDPRFDKNVSVDLQLGEGTFVRDRTRILDNGKPPKTLLLFPPSDTQLRMIGGV
jgi:hypothetical protein